MRGKPIMIEHNNERDATRTNDIEHSQRPTVAGLPDARPLQRRRHWRRAIVAALCAGAVAMLAVSCGGSSGASKTKTPNAATKAVATPTAGANVGLQTPIAFTPGADLTAQDLAARGTGPAGRGDFNGVALIIPSINVNAPFSVKSVPSNGQMPNPNSWNDVVYYDFSSFPGLGGVPGKGGNIVLAGHVDYIHHGPAVFWDLRELKSGDQVQIKMKDGSLATYQVVFNKHVGADTANFTSIVSATADESLTLITCTGDFNNGHYNERQIVWAKRV
jgi:LPXTG-site transpeptidase (sortase) family protein